MFEIKNSIDFYRLMIENYDDFRENPDSSRHAINCSISAYHMAEWIWGDWLKSDHESWKRMGGVRDRNSFKKWVDGETEWFKLVQGVANGSKHFASKLQNTRSAGTYVADGYVERGYQKERLEIEVDGRWIEATTVVEQTLLFWRDFFATYRPQTKLPSPRSPFTEFK